MKISMVILQTEKSVLPEKQERTLCACSMPLGYVTILVCSTIPIMTCVERFLSAPIDYGLMGYYSNDSLHYEKIGKNERCIEEEIPFTLPNGWSWTKINTIAFVTKLAGFEYTNNIAPNLCESGVP